MKTFEKIIGAVLFTALLSVFISSVFGMAEQGVSDSIRYSQDPTYNQTYISPSDAVLIEMMEERHE
ncbi:MAG: hypothetical protein Q3971_09640 [Moraxella sp.]|nr:hypothetical protein [Moraxella sp.]